MQSVIIEISIPSSNKSLDTHYEELLFCLKRIAGTYSDYFRKSGIRVKPTFRRNTPLQTRIKIKRITKQVNAYLSINDELNQYESPKLLLSC